MARAFPFLLLFLVCCTVALSIAACAAPVTPVKLQPSVEPGQANLSAFERCFVGTWSGTWNGSPSATEMTQLYVFSASRRYFEQLVPLAPVRTQQIVHGVWSASADGVVLSSRGARQVLALSLFRRLTPPDERDPACDEAAFAAAMDAAE